MTKFTQRAWARLAGEKLELQVFTTPADRSGRPVLEARFEFPRRTAPAGP